jgi:hypothetical protein
VVVDEKVAMLLADNFKNMFNQSVRWITGAFTFVKQHPNAFEKNTNIAVLMAPNYLLYLTTVFKIGLVIFLLCVLPFYFSIPIILSLLWYDLEVGHWWYMKTHGYITKDGTVLDKRITYFVGLMEYVNLLIAIKAYWRFKTNPLYWYLTEKEYSILTK